MAAFDLSTAMGAASVLVVVLLIFASYRSPWKPVPVALTAFATVLTVLSYGRTGLEGPLLADFGLQLTLLWASAFLVLAARRARERLEERTGSLFTILDTAVDGIILIDGSGTVVDYNAACERLFGYRAEEVVGRNVKMLMPQPYRDEHDSYLARYRSTGERRIIGIGREVEGRRKDGSTFPIELSVGEMQQRGRPIFVGIIRDVTARKQAATALLAAKERAEAAARAKSIFLANMSHEIRTPMNAVLGYTQLLETDPELPDKAHQPLSAIRNAGNHLMSLINDILDLSKIEAGAERPELGDFALDALLQGLSDIFSVRCQEKHLEWLVVRGFGAGQVRGDQRKLRQILINLLGNAVKFTDQGSVMLSVTQSEQSYRFEVKDTGPGISAAARQQIFEPFQQAEQGIAKGGTGLGLTIAKQLIELMGGVLEVRSQPGVGSCFSFSVDLPPATGNVAAEDEEKTSPCKLVNGQRVVALVVDDIADNRDILERMLQRLGAEVSAANNGEEALAALRRSAVDILFMDVRMPVMDGREAVRRIRQEWPGGRPVCIGVSASGINHEPRYYLELGFDDFIAKPFHLRRITECLSRHLGLEFEPAPLKASSPVEPPLRRGEAPPGVLPAKTRQRLQAAAELNAFTEIEAVLDELRSLDSTKGAVADYLKQFLSRYDRAGLLAALEQTDHE